MKRTTMKIVIILFVMLTITVMFVSMFKNQQVNNNQVTIQEHTSKGESMTIKIQKDKIKINDNYNVTQHLENVYDKG